ncbi:MAG: haloacid dehalogenase type II [Pseudomonadota bacterium]
MTAIAPPAALFFDVFGTVVDWRTSVIREGEAFGRRFGLSLDWAAFADAWRGRYQPQMETVRSGRRPWAKLDTLHRESLDALLTEAGVDGVPSTAVDDFNLAWHRLDPWPDSAAGLARLKRRCILATLSNGNVSLMVDLARRGGLPWDAILGAEVCRAYKPAPDAYLRSAALLDLAPSAVMMVAAHNDDLAAAAALGFRTAFVARPTEHGPGQTVDLAPTGDYDVVAADFLDLAKQLGC